MPPAYRAVVSAAGTVALLSMLVWEAVSGASPFVLAGIAVGAAYVAGLGVPSVYNRVPAYESAGMALPCLVSGSLLVAGGVRQTGLQLVGIGGLVAVLYVSREAIRAVRDRTSSG